MTGPAFDPLFQILLSLFLKGMEEEVLDGLHHHSIKVIEPSVDVLVMCHDVPDELYFLPISRYHMADVLGLVQEKQLLDTLKEVGDEAHAFP